MGFRLFGQLLVAIGIVDAVRTNCLFILGPKQSPIHTSATRTSMSSLHRSRISPPGVSRAFLQTRKCYTSKTSCCPFGPWPCMFFLAFSKGILRHHCAKITNPASTSCKGWIETHFRRRSARRPPPTCRPATPFDSCLQSAGKIDLGYRPPFAPQREPDPHP